MRSKEEHWGAQFSSIYLRCWRVRRGRLGPDNNSTLHHVVVYVELWLKSRVSHMPTDNTDELLENSLIY